MTVLLNSFPKILRFNMIPNWDNDIVNQFIRLYHFTSPHQLQLSYRAEENGAGEFELTPQKPAGPDAPVASFRTGDFGWLLKAFGQLDEAGWYRKGAQGQRHSADELVVALQYLIEHGAGDDEFEFVARLTQRAWQIGNEVRQLHDDDGTLRYDYWRHQATTEEGEAYFTEEDAYDRLWRHAAGHWRFRSEQLMLLGIFVAHDEEVYVRNH